MPREIVLGNGELLVNLDQNLFVRDIYYPYVGWANHVGGYRCRVGVWVQDGGLAWLDDAGWERKIAYAADTLVTDCTLRHAAPEPAPLTSRRPSSTTTTSSPSASRWRTRRTRSARCACSSPTTCGLTRATSATRRFISRGTGR